MASAAAFAAAAFAAGVCFAAATFAARAAAAVAFVLLVMAGVTSFRIARRRMKYETWWVVHLYMYAALMLAFAHQVATGVMFLGHPLARIFWDSLWAGVAAIVVHR